MPGELVKGATLGVLFSRNDRLVLANRERGRFRTYLLTAFNHFLADEWDKSRRLKRGGGQEIISFDAASAGERYLLEPVDHVDAAKHT